MIALLLIQFSVEGIADLRGIKGLPTIFQN